MNTTLIISIVCTILAIISYIIGIKLEEDRHYTTFKDVYDKTEGIPKRDIDFKTFIEEFNHFFFIELKYSLHEYTIAVPYKAFLSDNLCFIDDTIYKFTTKEDYIKYRGFRKGFIIRELTMDPNPGEYIDVQADNLELKTLNAARYRISLNNGRYIDK